MQDILGFPCLFTCRWQQHVSWYVEPTLIVSLQFWQPEHYISFNKYQLAKYIAAWKIVWDISERQPAVLDLVTWCGVSGQVHFVFLVAQQILVDIRLQESAIRVFLHQSLYPLLGHLKRIPVRTGHVIQRHHPRLGVKIYLQKKVNWWWSK